MNRFRLFFRRYLTLTDEPKLFYVKVLPINLMFQGHSEPKFIHLGTATQVDSPAKAKLRIRNDGVTYTFRCRSTEEALSWVSALRQVIQQKCNSDYQGESEGSPGKQLAQQFRKQ